MRLRWSYNQTTVYWRNQTSGLRVDKHLPNLTFLQSIYSAPTSPPLNVELSAIGSTSLLISWIPPPVIHRNGNMTGYEVCFSWVNSEENCERILRTKRNSIRLGYLSPASKYKVKILARNDAGPGNYSKEYFQITNAGTVHLRLRSYEAGNLASSPTLSVWNLIDIKKFLSYETNYVICKIYRTPCLQSFNNHGRSVPYKTTKTQGPKSSKTLIMRLIPSNTDTSLIWTPF